MILTFITCNNCQPYVFINYGIQKQAWSTDIPVYKLIISPKDEYTQIKATSYGKSIEMKFFKENVIKGWKAELYFEVVPITQDSITQEPTFYFEDTNGDLHELRQDANEANPQKIPSDGEDDEWLR